MTIKQHHTQPNPTHKIWGFWASVPRSRNTAPAANSHKPRSPILSTLSRLFSIVFSSPLLFCSLLFSDLLFTIVFSTLYSSRISSLIISPCALVSTLPFSTHFSMFKLCSSEVSQLNRIYLIVHEKTSFDHCTYTTYICIHIYIYKYIYYIYMYDQLPLITVYTDEGIQ